MFPATNYFWSNDFLYSQHIRCLSYTVSLLCSLLHVYVYAPHIIHADVLLSELIRFYVVLLLFACLRYGRRIDWTIKININYYHYFVL